MYWAFEVLITVLLKIQIWDVTPCCWVCGFYCFKRIIAPPSSGYSVPGSRSARIMALRSALFWDIMQCIVVLSYGHFRTIYHSHFKGSRIPVQEDFLTQNNSDIISFTVEA
jgi:hypothetical protein